MTSHVTPPRDMARFETTGQVVTLFVSAAAVAVIIILFLQAEVRHRNHEEEVEVVEADSRSLHFYNNLLNRVATFAKKFRSDFFISNLNVVHLTS